ncbi:MAG: hypothetical protein ABIN80_23500 [Dyadobacter sp.]|uniref:hypothetical protein n=1 Tax=Dyadobacter sp. TaxID=1914288 RepID=UPI00326670E4
MTGGKVVAVGAGSPEEGFDYDRNTFNITGGILVGVAGATSTPNATASRQPSVLLGGSGTYTPGTKSTTFTTSSMVTMSSGSVGR